MSENMSLSEKKGLSGALFSEISENNPWKLLLFLKKPGCAFQASPPSGCAEPCRSLRIQADGIRGASEGQYSVYGPSAATTESAACMRKGKKKTWRLPTLPHCCSTIGVRALDFRVRDGNGYFHSAMATRSACMWKPEVLCPLGPLMQAFRILVRDKIDNMVKPFG